MGSFLIGYMEVRYSLLYYVLLVISQTVSLVSNILYAIYRNILQYGTTGFSMQIKVFTVVIITFTYNTFDDTKYYVNSLM